MILSLLRFVVLCFLCVLNVRFGGWFGVVVSALVTSTKLSYTSSPVSTGIGNQLWWVYHQSRYVPGHSGPLSLAIPPCVGAESTVDGFGHRWGRNGEFCVAVGPATRTACMLCEVG